MVSRAFCALVLHRALTRVVLLACVMTCASACLVLSLNPAYDDETIAWEPELIGKWQDSEDNASLDIARGEWRSYKVHYVHPIETGDLTAYLTAIGDARYLDLMPARGEDRGSFLVPVHAILRMRLQGDTLELTPLSYDWFFIRTRKAQAIPGLNVWEDQKENALIVSPTPRLRAWLRGQSVAGAVFGVPATFERTEK